MTQEERKLLEELEQMIEVLTADFEPYDECPYRDADERARQIITELLLS